MNNALKPYIQPAFIVCVATLAIAAGSKELAIKWLGWHLQKLPIDLRKSLDELDEARLAPYRVTARRKIELSDVRESFGTDNYIQWEIEDTEADPSSRVKYCYLFVSYYTGNPDRVPHVPEECITGGAGDTMMSRDVERLRLDVGDTPFEDLEVHGGITRLPVRYLVFLRNATELWQKYAVLYFFKANGRYASSRAGTRRIMGENLFGKYSYFSKVEWQFYGRGPGGIVQGSKEEILRASERLMSRLLPLLETEHWPDWKAANEKQEDKIDATLTTTSHASAWPFQWDNKAIWQKED